jgi:hypothetical protein
VIASAPSLNFFLTKLLYYICTIICVYSYGSVAKENYSTCNIRNFGQFISSKIKTFHALNFLKKVIGIKELYLFYRAPFFQILWWVLILILILVVFWNPFPKKLFSGFILEFLISWKALGVPFAEQVHFILSITSFSQIIILGLYKKIKLYLLA